MGWTIPSMKSKENGKKRNGWKILSMKSKEKEKSDARFTSTNDLVMILVQTG